MNAKKPIFATSADAEAAFYEAVDRADIESMMSVWAEDEEIICILPAGPRLIGYSAVREAWRRLFEGRQRVQLRVSPQGINQNPFMAVHSNVEELIISGEERRTGVIVSTNIFIRGPLGWRLIIHHASPAPPDAVGEVPKILH